MAATHCFNIMSHLGHLRLDQGAKKGLHPHHPELCWCRARIPDICDRTVVVLDINNILPEINILTQVLSSAVTTLSFYLTPMFSSDNI